MTERVRADAIEIDFRLHDFVGHEAAPGTGVDPAAFWRGFAALVRRLAPRNAALLARRDTLQAQIDDWHRQHPGALFDPASYRAFLAEIGYLRAGTRRFRHRYGGRGCGNRAHRGSAIGGSHHQRALCLERRQCPLGQPLRCALRNGRDRGTAPCRRLRCRARRARDRLRARLSG